MPAEIMAIEEKNAARKEAYREFILDTWQYCSLRVGDDEHEPVKIQPSRVWNAFVECTADQLTVNFTTSILNSTQSIERIEISLLNNLLPPWVRIYFSHLNEDGERYVAKYINGMGHKEKEEHINSFARDWPHVRAKTRATVVDPDNIRAKTRGPDAR